MTEQAVHESDSTVHDTTRIASQFMPYRSLMGSGKGEGAFAKGAKTLLHATGWVASLVYAAIAIVVMMGPPTWSAIAYLLGIGALIAGLMTLPRYGKVIRRRPRGMARGALIAIAVVTLIRIASARSGESVHVQVVREGVSSDSVRIVDRLFDEKDVAIAGTRIVFALGMFKDDTNEAPAAMRVAYDEMRSQEGDAPSPVLATYLGLQDSRAFDLILIEPKQDSQRPRDTAIIYLHGFGGSFVLPCWQMARAVASLHALTACPATSSIGNWWSADGEVTLRHTIDVLHKSGISRIVLAGLSNGGIGASRLAPIMPGTFAALILISGEDGSAPAAGIPTLVLHGRSDSAIPFLTAQRYAARTGAQLVPLDAGHFAMLVRAKEHDAAVRAFLEGVLG